MRHGLRRRAGFRIAPGPEPQWRPWGPGLGLIGAVVATALLVDLYDPGPEVEGYSEIAAVEIRLEPDTVYQTTWDPATETTHTHVIERLDCPDCAIGNFVVNWDSTWHQHDFAIKAGTGAPSAGARR